MGFGAFGFVGRFRKAFELPGASTDEAPAPAGRSRIRYDEVNDRLQVSTNAKAYIPVDSGYDFGPDLVDGPQDIRRDEGKVRVLPAGTLTQGSAVTLLDEGAVDGDELVIIRQDEEAFAFTVRYDGSVIGTFGASTAGTGRFIRRAGDWINAGIAADAV